MVFPHKELKSQNPFLASMGTFTHAHAHTQDHAHTHTRAHVCTHTHILPPCTYTHATMPTHIHVHMHAHIHTSLNLLKYKELKCFLPYTVSLRFCDYLRFKPLGICFSECSATSSGLVWSWQSVFPLPIYLLVLSEVHNVLGSLLTTLTAQCHS